MTKDKIKNNSNVSKIVSSVGIFGSIKEVKIFFKYFYFYLYVAYVAI